MVFANLLIYLASFVAIWLGAGLIVAAVSKFSHKLRLSPFAFSFIFLGILTSTPEFSVGLQAVADQDAEIFVGNLLGGIAVIFFLVIPLLAVLGNGINLKHELEEKTLIFTLGVILAPSVLILDKRVTNAEGIILILLYLVMLFLVQRKNGIFDSKNEKLLHIKAYSLTDILKVLAGVGIVFLSSNLIVDKTLYFADIFAISPFYISLIVVSLGTNLPELSLAVRSVVTGKKEVAMGDYLGSAAANTLLFGIFTLLHNGEVLTVSNFLTTYIFIAISVLLFYRFSYARQQITRKNGYFLLGIYVIFVLLELMR